MTIELSYATFAGCRGDGFLVSREGMCPIELELVEIQDLCNANRKLPQHVRQDPFQLLLRGPTEPLLRQGLYTFSHGETHTYELFLVPIGCEDGSTWYNVVVN